MLALDGMGGAEYFADYDQWENRVRAAPATSRQPGTGNRQPARKRLSYLEQRELDSMKKTLHAAEERLHDARTRAEDPSIAADAAALQQRFADVDAVQAEVDRL